MHSQIIKVTPALAESWLQENTFNRSVSRHVVQKYSSDMKSGNWRLNHQGIAFDDSGVLVDGQHRLLAIVDSGTSVEMMVTWGAERTGIDELRVRSAADVVKFGGMSDWLDVKSIACAKAIWSITTSIEGRSVGVISTSQIVEFAEKNKDAIVFSESLFSNHSKGISSALCRAVIAIAYYHCGKNDLSEFVSTLYSGIVSTPLKSASIRCREMLLSGAASGGAACRKESALKMMRAIEAFVENKPLSRLMVPNKPPYALPGEKK